MSPANGETKEFCVHPFLTAEHEAFGDTVRRFVRAEITPFAADCEVRQ